MFSIFKSNKEKVNAFATGTVYNIGKVNDDVFSLKMMGEGIAIDSTEGKVYAPLAGEVTAIFPTQHAIGITTELGIEYLIHIGIDTLHMTNVFKCLVAVSEKVEVGQLLIEYDYEFFCKNKLDKVVILVFVSKVRLLNVKYTKVTLADVIADVQRERE